MQPDGQGYRKRLSQLPYEPEWQSDDRPNQAQSALDRDPEKTERQ
jgi:hypothetical protein